MNSTSISDQDTILEIKNLSMSFNLLLFQQKQLRDIFVDLISSPHKIFFNRSSKLEIIENLNLTIKKGERVGLLGVNGAGKTSLCRAISGLYGDKAEIKVNGNLRSIFDTTSVIHPELSGRENAWIMSNIIYAHLPKTHRKRIVEESIEFSELGKLIDQPFKFYSRGMKVRLFLSIVSSEPCDLLILDEVFDGADSFFNEKISKRIKKVITDSGAVIFISHSEELIREVCNKTIVLGSKSIIFEGGVEEGLDFYKKKFSNSASNEIQFS